MTIKELHEIHKRGPRVEYAGILKLHITERKEWIVRLGEFVLEISVSRVVEILLHVFIGL